MENCYSHLGYVDSNYLDQSGAVVRLLKERSYQRMRLSPEDIILDLGCGIGIDTLQLSALVGEKGRIYGVDHDAEMVNEANERSALHGKSNQVKHSIGDANSIPFPDDYFDVCRAERLLMHVDEPAKVVRELYRVLKADGRMVLVEPDWATLSFHTEDVETERQIARIRAEKFLRNGYSGRMLYPLIQRQGLREIQLEIIPLWTNDFDLADNLTVLQQVEAFAVRQLLLDEEAIKGWRMRLSKAQQEGVFYASLNFVMVSGIK